MNSIIKRPATLVTFSLVAAGYVSPAIGEKAQTAQYQKARLQIAEAMFQERCKSAREKIYRTAESVEGVFLMKIRPVQDNLSDQFALDDPYGRDMNGIAYIQTFFTRKLSRGNKRSPCPGFASSHRLPLRGSH